MSTLLNSASGRVARESAPPVERKGASIGVPELAGVCSYTDAGKIGFSVDSNVALLKRYNWVEMRLNEMLIAHLNSTPEWEVKDALALHSWLDAEHAKWLQERVAELRHPPHQFHLPPDECLDRLMQEAIQSEDTVELLTAIFKVVRPALIEAYHRHIALSNPLIDQPTRRFLRFILLEEEEMLGWGQKALSALLTNPAARERSRHWEAHLKVLLEDARRISGEIAPGEPMNDQAPRSSRDPDSETVDVEQAVEVPEGTSHSARASVSVTGDRPADDAVSLPAGDRSESGSSVRLRSVKPFEPDFTPRRDARFESYNYHFPPHWIYAQQERPADERMLSLVCKRLLEMDVPEMMAAIIWRARREALSEGKPLPWDYTADMCRQVWDEARHSMMGETWLTLHGVDFTRVPLNVGFSLGLNQFATAREAHAALYWIEQGLMPRTTGKAYEWRVAVESGDELAALFMDYDWADEVLHVHIGRWLVEKLGSRSEAERLGSEAFSRVMAIRRRKGLDGAGLTEQREWWPEFCQDVLGYTPEPLAPEVYETPDQDAPWLRNG